MTEADPGVPRSGVPEAEPCPFCGGPAYVTRTVNGTQMFKVGCTTCGVELKAAWYRDEPKPTKDILALWNQRAEARSGVAPLDRIRQLAFEKARDDHRDAICCGPAPLNRGHGDDEYDATGEYGFSTCSHPDCKLVRALSSSGATPQEIARLRGLARAYEALELCPDHRDKHNGRCVVCVAEERTRAEREWVDHPSIDEQQRGAASSGASAPPDQKE